MPGPPAVRQPLGNDGLIGNAQSGAASGSRDNANMNTGADGTHPTTNQFVWQPLAGFVLRALRRRRVRLLASSATSTAT